MGAVCALSRARSAFRNACWIHLNTFRTSIPSAAASWQAEYPARLPLNATSIRFYLNSSDDATLKARVKKLTSDAGRRQMAEFLENQFLVARPGLLFHPCET